MGRYNFGKVILMIVVPSLKKLMKLSPRKMRTSTRKTMSFTILRPMKYEPKISLT
jgi:hypothetical protein